MNPLERRRLGRRALFGAAAGLGLSVPLGSRGVPLGAGAVPIGLRGLGAVHANPRGARARRLIVFYYPDGIPAPPGQGSPFLATGAEAAPVLPAGLRALEPYRAQCVFFRGLSLGPTDSGSHPGGAKKLLTAVDGGNGESIDRVLARTIGAAAPVKHLYLGAMATHGNASGDKFISYPAAGTTVAPEDDPRRAFARLFGTTPSGSTGSGSGASTSDDLSVLDTVMADLRDLRARAGASESSKLNLHMEALRDVERRLRTFGGGGSNCQSPNVGLGAFDNGALGDPARFPDVLRTQIDLMVLAMACGLTQVGVLQASQHTSELIMSRFPRTELHRPGFDMRSHQASHYGDTGDAKYADYVAQRVWWMAQFAYLLDALGQRPEATGTMLDHSLVLACSEVSDGNVHSHDDMPFILAGGGGNAIRTGRLLSFGYQRHGALLVAIARALGSDLRTFGDQGSEALPGLLAS